MDEMCTDNRFELIAKYKTRLVEATNIEASQEEMKVIDNILFRFWQMGWLDKLEKAERNKGEWIKPTGMMPPEHFGRHLCSKCDGFALHDWKHHKEQLTDFCPNCGADMRGDNNDRD